MLKQTLGVELRGRVDRQEVPAISQSVHSHLAWLTIGQGKVAYEQEEAEAVLAGFAFGTTELIWPVNFSPPRDDILASKPRVTARGKWAYRIYDCVPREPNTFEVGDLFLVAALDARVGSKALLAMEAVLPELNETLAEVDIAQTFWTLPAVGLADIPPRARAGAWCLWRTWTLLRGLDGIGPTIADKMLHHKRPWLFPIFDDATRPAMGAEDAWRVLHGELRDQTAQFIHLEQWFSARAAERGGVGLTRLRIHDILHWGAIARRGAAEPSGSDSRGPAGTYSGVEVLRRRLTCRFARPFGPDRALAPRAGLPDLSPGHATDSELRQLRIRISNGPRRSTITAAPRSQCMHSHAAGRTGTGGCGALWLHRLLGQGS